MPADLPPVSTVSQTVNVVAAELGVGRPPVLDTVDGLVAAPRAHARADGCLHLDVGHEAALALRAHVTTH